MGYQLFLPSQSPGFSTTKMPPHPFPLPIDRATSLSYIIILHSTHKFTLLFLLHHSLLSTLGTCFFKSKGRITHIFPLSVITLYRVQYHYVSDRWIRNLWVQIQDLVWNVWQHGWHFGSITILVTSKYSPKCEAKTLNIVYHLNCLNFEFGPQFKWWPQLQI
jgi:hypothetical protein